MADIKLSEVPVLTTMAAGDYIPFTSDPAGTPASKNITKANLFTSPALVTPALGTPASGTLTNCTGLPAAGIVPGTAESDFLVATTTPFTWVKKTLAEVKTILGLASNVPAATAESDFMVSTSTPFAWVKKTLAEVKTILGLSGTVGGNVPASTAANDFQVGDSTTGNWIKKTLAEVLAILMPSPGAIGETTPNSIRGTNKEIFKTADADSPLTAAQCAGTIVSNYGMTDADCTIDLPTAVEGLSFVCILPAVQAHFFKLHCPTAQADKIYLLGVAGADDGNVGVASGYATGSAASFFTFKASDGGYDWFCIPIFGTWVAS